MSRLTRQAGLAVLGAAALLAGCQGDGVGLARRFEQAGSFHLAYEEYLRAASDPSKAAAAAGLRRTAGKAALYWLQQALAAADRGDWRLAALCHLKTLRIQPDEVASTLVLRQIDEKHPDDLERACEAFAAGQAMKELLALPAQSLGALVAAATEKPAAPPDKPAPPKPAAEVSAGPVAPARPPSGPRIAQAGVLPPPKPPQPPRPAPRPPIDPFQQHPSARHVPGSADRDFVMVVRVSRDDDRYPKQRDLLNGLAIKVKDTDKSPLDADMEVYLKGRRIARFDDLPRESVLDVLDAEGQGWQIVIVEIHDRDETVTVGLRRP